MVDRARQRLAGSPNSSVALEDGQSLSFDAGSFDVVLCSLGLMFFPDPARGLSEFHRVLRPGGRAAVSVNTTPEHSYNGRINVIMARRMPSLAEATARTFSLGDAARLRPCSRERASETWKSPRRPTASYSHPSRLISNHSSKGGGSSGQVYVLLPEEERRAVREEVRRNVGDTGGPIGIEVELRFASGRREQGSELRSAV